MTERKSSGQESNRDEPSSSGPGRPGTLKIIQSVLAGALGVQSSKRHEEDFNSSSPWPYIIGGLVFTGGFVLTLVLIVQWVLASQ